MVFSINGCGGSTAMPNSINGRYYMAGDPSCARYRVLSNTRIMCKDSNGRDTGWRNAMTNQEISMYQHNQSQSNYNYQQNRNRRLYQYGY